MPEISQMMIVVPGDGIKLVAAFVVGLLLGAEREYHDKSAGMRTLIMITVGSCLFTIFSMRIAGDNDPGRIAAQIVTGIGFLGAGVIIQRRGQVVGLTTASTIWVAAALGIGVGIGYLLFTIVAALLVIFVLAVLPTFERYLQTANALRQYKITTTLDEGEPERLMKLFKETNLTVREDGRTKAKDSIVLNWSVAGKPDAHRRVCDAMIHDPLVRDFDH
ncbi:MAG: MgtC/SapB family protein [Anaerolineae bacterium]|jgi:putative Mg2+ transporter-C (MgtC) family protein|nr:MgtC/SapB family protein [Anaerolineae bacterium]